MTHSILLLVLNALAVFRLTWLLVHDVIAAPVRALFERGQAGREFVSCPWCVSIWVAALVLVAQALVPGQWIYLAVLLAYSAVAGILAELV